MVEGQDKISDLCDVDASIVKGNECKVAWSYSILLRSYQYSPFLWLAGLLSIPLLPVALLPSLTYPRLIVRTTFGNARSGRSLKH